jgi:rare lipoprotein A
LRSHSAGRGRPRHAVVAALALGTTLSVTAFAFGEDPPAPAPQAALHAPQLQDATLRLGQRADVRGHVATAAAGRSLALQYAPRGGRWRVLASSRAEAGGAYRFRVRLKRSGALRVALTPDAAPAAEGAAGFAAAEAPGASRPRHVAVAARLVVRHRDRDVRAGVPVHVRGTLLPRTRGRRVVVEAGAHRRWHAVARARTRTHGDFDARLTAAGLGTQRLRVRFAGDRHNAGTRARAGTLQAFRPSLATWYDLSGNTTACGQVLSAGTLGVANKTLPCGTKVTIRYHGREVTVPVIDRGPYAGAREWDLTVAVAQRLGLISAGVDTVWVTR